MSMPNESVTAIGTAVSRNIYSVLGSIGFAPTKKSAE